LPSMDEEDDIRRFLVRGTGSQLAANKSLKDMLDDIEGSGFSTTTDSLKVLSDVLDLIRTELTFEHQADATLSQANPTQNNWYTVLAATANVRVIGITVRVATTGETLQCEIVVDGVTLGIVDLAAVADTDYWVVLYTASTGLFTYMIAVTDDRLNRPFLIEGRNVRVRVRKTTANGTGTLASCVSYATR